MKVTDVKTKEIIMEKAGRNFKRVCYVLLVCAGIFFLYYAFYFLSAIFAPNPDWGTAVVFMGSGVAIIIALSHLLLALWGLHNVKKCSGGWLHFFLYILLLCMALSFVDFNDFAYTTNNPELFIQLTVSIVWLAVLIAYGWFAFKFKILVLKNKK